ncbi:hypothetical protein [Crenobacter oryzisoli]|uniref:hypothetical protein n=1 Tax=Crenobacter oryzisoli TaxID=3056844 RepID=UPI003F494AD5
MRKRLKRHRRPRVIVTDQLRRYAAANDALGLKVAHRQHQGLNNRVENRPQPTRVREKVIAGSSRRASCSASPRCPGRFRTCSWGAVTIAGLRADDRLTPRPCWPGKGLRAPAGRHDPGQHSGFSTCSQQVDHTSG